LESEARSGNQAANQEERSDPNPNLDQEAHEDEHEYIRPH
jgi:hypothetical protein